MLTLDRVSAFADGKKILHNITYDFQPGQIYALMGPNGSGKSTLASVIMGNPAYTLSETARLIFNNEDITRFTPDKRAQKGLFLSFQSPLSLSGVTVYQLMRYMLDKKMDPLAIRQKTKNYARRLKINEELLNRSLNDGASGGEKKKMEVLQAAIADPQLIFFDEIDTGVDIDALKTIAQFIKKMMDKSKTFVVITHYNRILKYLKPDVVMVMINGRLTKIGTAALAREIEKNGYQNTGGVNTNTPRE